VKYILEVGTYIERRRRDFNNFNSNYSSWEWIITSKKAVYDRGEIRKATDYYIIWLGLEDYAEIRVSRKLVVHLIENADDERRLLGTDLPQRWVNENERIY
jgi:hypothetical protein